MTSDHTDTDSSQDNSSGNGGNGSRRRALLIALVGLLACAIVAAAYWWTTRNLVSTEDAFVRADVAQIAPRIKGTVASVHVQDNEHVEAGELLVELDPEDYEVALAQARANLAAARANHRSSQRSAALQKSTGGAAIERAQAALQSARAEAEQANADLKRYQKLYAKDEVPEQRFDQARTTAETAEARVEQARAQLAEAKTAPQQVAVKKARAESAEASVAQAKAALEKARLELSYTEIRASRSGKVTNKSVLAGENVSPGGAMMAVVSDQPWVVANFKETQLARMEPGQPVDIEIDAYPDHAFHGHVQSIQSGTGAAFSLLPPQNATGNFVKVVQRVPVKIVFDEMPETGLVPAPGMSAVPTVNVGQQGRSAADEQPADG